MKRRLSLLLCIVLLLIAIPGVARADFGPKPSIDISFTGLEGETYFVCLLGRVDNEGYLYPLTLAKAMEEGYHTWLPEAELQLFLKFEDSDGFVPLYDGEECSSTHHFSLSRFPPDEFKVLIYFPKTGNFVESDRIYDNYAFNSYYRIDAASCGLTHDSSGEMNLKLQNGYVYFGAIVSFLVRLVITLAIEISIAWAFKLREKRVLKLIVIVNIITQTLLTFTLSWVDFFNGSLASILLYVLLETVVFLIEAIIYSVRVNKISAIRIPHWKLWLFSWVANTVSFFAGLFLLSFAMMLMIV